LQTKNFFRNILLTILTVVVVQVSINLLENSQLYVKEDVYSLVNFVVLLFPYLFIENISGIARRTSLTFLTIGYVFMLALMTNNPVSLPGKIFGSIFMGIIISNLGFYLHHKRRNIK
jgi:hypothetical protein